MVSVNDYVNYSGQGICKVESISPLQFGHKVTKNQYYTLRPVFQKSLKVYVPVDESELVERMRPVLSPREVDQVIMSTKGKKLSLQSDHKERSVMYHDILSTRNERDLLLLSESLYKKSKRAPKGLTPGELEVFRAAEKIITQEFSFSLKIPSQDVGNYIKAKLGVA